MRPRPVPIYGIGVTVLGVLTESADAADILPEAVFPYLRLLLGLLLAAGAFVVQSQVTPVSSPQDNKGRPLVPKVLHDRLSPGDFGV